MNQKLGFPLDVKDGWPPYDVEHIWVELIDENYKIRSIPFFLKGVAYDDLLEAKVDPDGYVSDWSTVLASPNSTIWIIEHRDTDVSSRLADMGCGVEREEIHHLVSVNVPPSIDVYKLDSLLEIYEDDGDISVAVPVDRIGLNDLGDSGGSIPN